MKLLSLLLVVACGCPTGAAFAGETSALAAALDAIREDRYLADMHFLASDELRGRDTPSPELHIASLYIKTRVEQLGFQPGAEDGWFQKYPLYSSSFDQSGSFLRASAGEQSIEFEFGTDYYFMLASHAFDTTAKAELICVGKGSKRILADLDLTGKWALLLDSGRVVRSSVTRCYEAGAVGVLITPGPTYTKDSSYPDRYQRRAGTVREPSKPTLNPPKVPVEPIPVAMLGRSGAQRLFAMSGTELTEGFPETGAMLGIELHEQRKLTRHDVEVSNVCAFWPGSDPERGAETMIVSAHYDHVGKRDNGDIYNGADNASGTCGLLALADALVAYGPLERSVLLLWVSGEEKGLWGSKVWATSPWLPSGARAVLDLNIDMIGRNAPKKIYLTPTSKHPSFNKVSEAAYGMAKLEGFARPKSQDSYWERSDHYHFDQNLGIPVAFLSCGIHDDYHKHTDTPEKIDSEKLARVTRTIMRLLDHLQAGPLE